MINLTEAVGPVRGHFKSKHNRAAKLIARWPELLSKFRGMVGRGGGQSETARLAYAVLVMMETGVRVGNEGSAEGFVCANKWSEHHGKVVQTYGLTTLRAEHVRKTGGRVWLDFTGKKLVHQTLCLTDPILVRHCPLPKEGLWLTVGYSPLKRFVKKYVGKQFSPKDIRTAKVNLYFVASFVKRYAKSYTEATTVKERKALLKSCIEGVAEQVGHTPGVCKKSYLSNPLYTLIAGCAVGTKFREK